ncbi:MAG: integrase arm-type DNA-binding domain-containing protein [Paracoccus sp. (in: a-proteobacteria)]|uniref:tyrosine-type recombinase/integrase n=1 Tax=Paracoccus sp. TaxID=267 RepID=UPI0026E03EA3|nr:integrase arm-type DNA-binding domain-containing protein [Paracoccus sp. (in: a-proteobacteria)]MDO5630526.1 integrase arm-type DNA-binding domain-containing protein [Paracoccus sp. (in: a-proteobacteria)]
MALTDTALRGLKPESKPKKYSDGGGLFLMVNPNGSKLWRLAYRFDGKQKTLAFGAYPAVRLADARALRDRAKKALADGIDPARHTNIATTDHDTFAAIGKEWLAAQEPTWAPKYAPQVMRQFERDVFPDLGQRPITEIEPSEVLKVLRAVEARGAQDIAKRLRQKISAIFRFAIATDRAKLDPAANLKGALKPPPKTRHMAALRAADMPEFMQKLRAFDGDPKTVLALELLIHTMTRTNEVRYGRWDEIDGDLWRIPADRMKAGRDHIIPLSKQAKAILDKLRALAGKSEWIAEGSRGKPMSENTMLFALYRMGYHSRATTHGFRSTASTILNESELWRADAIERQLAHVPTDSVRSAYNAALYLDERNRMLQWWSDKLDSFESAGISQQVTKNPDTDISDLLI